MVQCVGNVRIAKDEVAGQRTGLLDDLRHVETGPWSLTAFPVMFSYNAVNPAIG